MGGNLGFHPFFVFEVGGWELEVGGWELEVGSWKLEVGEWKTEGQKLETGD